MYKKCQHCGFKNPPDVGDCLVCHKDLPITRGEFREGMQALGKAVKGDWSGVAKKSVDDFVGEQVSSLKYRFHPVWWLKVKLHHLNQSLISLLWILGIILGLALLGGIINLFKK